VDLCEDRPERLPIPLRRLAGRVERALEQLLSDVLPPGVRRDGDVAQQCAPALPVPLDEREPGERALVRTFEVRAGDEAVLLGLPRLCATPQPRRPVVRVLLLVRIQEVRDKERAVDRTEEFPVRVRA
jgi:hypothetical protein